MWVYEWGEVNWDWNSNKVSLTTIAREQRKSEYFSCGWDSKIVQRESFRTFFSFFWYINSFPYPIAAGILRLCEKLIASPVRWTIIHGMIFNSFPRRMEYLGNHGKCHCRKSAKFSTCFCYLQGRSIKFVPVDNEWTHEIQIQLLFFISLYEFRMHIKPFISAGGRSNWFKSHSAVHHI